MKGFTSRTASAFALIGKEIMNDLNPLPELPSALTKTTTLINVN